MAILFYEIESDLSQIQQERRNQFLKSLEFEVGDSFQKDPLDGIPEAPYILLFVASGGSENHFMSLFKKYSPKPFYLLTSGESNSLSAALEILSFIQKHGGRGEILHGDIPQIAHKICILERVRKSLLSLKGKYIGCVGAPSDWLIASECNINICREKLGTNYIDIPIDELIAEARRGQYEENQWTEEVLKNFNNTDGLELALGIYGGLQRLIKNYSLSALTIRCFDLLSKLHSTGCLGLSILNAQGVYASCEGDLPALNMMMILGEIAKQPTFMCNPNRINGERRTVLFAHCTLPINMPRYYDLSTHYESKQGVAIAGKLPLGHCTVSKIDGDLSNFFAANGEIVDMPEDRELCRTQVTVKMEDWNYFLRSPIGNHHILCMGKYADDIEEFMDLIK